MVPSLVLPVESASPVATGADFDDVPDDPAADPVDEQPASAMVAMAKPAIVRTRRFFIGGAFFAWKFDWGA
jgi:hypothetical protein